MSWSTPINGVRAGMAAGCVIVMIPDLLLPSFLAFLSLIPEVIPPDAVSIFLHQGAFAY